MESQKSKSCKLYFQQRENGAVNEAELEESIKKDRINRQINDPEILKCQKEELLRYYEISTFSGAKINTLRNNFNSLHLFATQCKKSFHKVTEEDVRKHAMFISNTGINGKGCKDSTVNQRLAAIKKFLTHLGNSKAVSWIKCRRFDTHIEQSKLLTPSEIQDMLKHSYSSRNKCFIRVLYESGARIGEILNLRVKNILVQDHGIRLELNGKTGKRTVLLIDSTPIVQEYLNNHPFKDNPEAPFFFSEGKNTFGRALKYSGGRAILVQTAKLCGIKKPIRPHLFRHARLDWLGEHENFNERDLRTYAGWNNKSDMPSVYLHYGEKAIESKLLKSRGIVTEKENLENKKEKAALQDIICPRCQRKNDSSALYCNCGLVLDQKTALKEQKAADREIEKTMEIFKTIAQNPELMQQFEKFKQRVD